MSGPNYGNPPKRGPCYDCKDRVVINGHRCHGWCEKYAKWKEDYERSKQELAEQKRRLSNSTEASFEHFKERRHHNRIMDYHSKL